MRSPVLGQNSRAGDGGVSAWDGRLVRRCAEVLGGALVLLLGLSMTKRLDHDEHQFIASAALLARRGLLPYRDYPYFHAPYMVFLYAGLFKVTDHLLLGARLVAVACSFGTVTILFVTALRMFRGHGARIRLLAAAGTLVMVMANPVFSLTSGRSWNRDLPTFLMVAAIVLLWNAAKGGGKIGAIVLGGMLMGLATGVRLTFAPMALAVLPLTWIVPGLERKRRAQMGAAYCAGVVLALLPAMAMWRIAPAQFMFGNFEYPRLNTAFRLVTGDKGAMTGVGKIWFLVKGIVSQLGNFAIVALLVVTAGFAWFTARERVAGNRVAIASVVVLLCAALIGSFAPTPLFKMYFFTPLPLVVLLILLMAEPICRDERLMKRWGWAAMGAMALSLPTGAYEYRGVVALADSGEWVPMRVHAAGVEIARRVPRGTTIMTVSPLLPLEGKCDVFEQFAAGSFPLRISGMLSDEEEVKFHALDDDDLRVALMSRWPHAVLTGMEPGLDRELIANLGGVAMKKQRLASRCWLWRDENVGVQMASYREATERVGTRADGKR